MFVEEFDKSKIHNDVRLLNTGFWRYSIPPLPSLYFWLARSTIEIDESFKSLESEFTVN
jgi:hypothetical protein